MNESGTHTNLWNAALPGLVEQALNPGHIVRSDSLLRNGCSLKGDRLLSRRSENEVH